MRNISFSLTEPQILAGTKLVTRRLGWLHARPKMRLMGVRKAMGLRPGEKIVRLRQIRVQSVRREPLHEVGDAGTDREEARLEGFPDLDARGFVEMFMRHMHCTPETPVTRIQFAYHIQRACPRCTLGVMDGTNPHIRGLCVCPCHEGDCYGCNVRSTENDDHDCLRSEP